MIWRVIVTDSESMTGVAPQCDFQDSLEGNHAGDSGDSAWLDKNGVYDCCPQPHIETYSEDGALRLRALLSELDARLCS